MDAQTSVWKDSEYHWLEATGAWKKLKIVVIVTTVFSTFSQCIIIASLACLWKQICTAISETVSVVHDGYLHLTVLKFLDKYADIQNTIFMGSLFKENCNPRLKMA